MIFGEAKLEDCQGAVLAHALVLPDRRLKKGHVLSLADLSQIEKNGAHSLVVARLEEGDVGEDEAAQRLGACLEESGLRAEAPFTGRVNLYAEHDGYFGVDCASVDGLNGIDPAITLATLPDGELVESGRMVATVKIISFAVSGAVLNTAIDQLQEKRPLSVSPIRPKRVFMIQTQLPSLKPSVLDKTRRVLDARLTLSKSWVEEEKRVEHSQTACAEALQSLVEENALDASRDLIIFFGASAIADPDDVIPAGLKQVGGQVVHLGMPVDPGNLLMLGTYKGCAVIGAPGCARSPAENGFDWVLQRILHNVPVGSAYITSLGVGGLLMEIHDRPQPREPDCL